MNRPPMCPACKNGNLSPFDTTATSVILTCDKCSAITTAKTRDGAVIELAVPGIVTAATTYAILELLGVDSVDELTDWLENII